MIREAADVDDKWRTIVDCLGDDLAHHIAYWKSQYPRRHWFGLKNHLLRIVEEEKIKERVR